MTYGELSNIKTFGFETNHIIDDAVNNARFSYGKKFWGSIEVSNHDLNQISQFAKREGVSFPPPASVPPTTTCIEHAYGTTTRLTFQIKVF